MLTLDGFRIAKKAQGAIEEVLRLPAHNPRVWSIMGALLVCLYVVDALLGIWVWAPLVEFVLAASILLLARDFISRGMAGWVSRKSFSYASLIALCSVGAFGYSFLTASLGVLGRLSASHLLVLSGGEAVPQLYFTASVSLVFGACLGRYSLGRCDAFLRGTLERHLQAQNPEMSESELAERMEWATSTTPMRSSSTLKQTRSSVVLARSLDLGLSFAALILALVVLVGTFKYWEGLHGGLVGLVLGLLIWGVPGVFGVAVRSARKAGIIRAYLRGCRFRGATALDRLAECDLMCFKKFRTLTTGCPQVTDVLPVRSGISPEEILYMASALEYRAEHPIREAILLRTTDSCRTLPQIKEYHFTVGRGVRAVFQGQDMRFGNIRYLTENGVPCGEVENQVEELSRFGKTVLLLSNADEVLGIIALADEPRAEASEVIRRMRDMGIRTELFSGDHQKTVEFLARELPFDETHSELNQEETLAVLHERRSHGYRAAMVAGARYDFPTLTHLGVGIVLGSGKDRSIKPHEIHLNGQDLRKVAKITEIARETRRWGRQSLAAVLIYQSLFLPLVLLPFTSVALFDGSLLAGPYRAYWLSLFGLATALMPALVMGLSCLRLSRWQRGDRR